MKNLFILFSRQKNLFIFRTRFSFENKTFSFKENTFHFKINPFHIEINTFQAFFRFSKFLIIFRLKAEKYYGYERKPSNFGGILGEKSLNQNLRRKGLLSFWKVQSGQSYDINSTILAMCRASNFQPKAFVSASLGDTPMT